VRKILFLNSFDHESFGISAAEADRMDVSQKLLLTTTKEALLDAGMMIFRRISKR
jgi:acyl transferase domain-containing protein